MPRIAKYVLTAILTVIVFGSVMIPPIYKNGRHLKELHDETVRENVNTILTEQELEAINILEVNGPTVEETPEIKFFTDRIPLEDIDIFTERPLGSCGWLDEGWSGQFIHCMGSNPGDVCMVRIRTKRDTEWQYIQTCGKTDEPIARFDMETQEWVIVYDRKVQLL